MAVSWCTRAIWRAGTGNSSLRPLGSLVSRPIPGTSGAPVLPTVSWDGSQVAFIAVIPPPATIRVASLRGGPPLTLVDSGFRGPPAWGPGGYVYFMGTGDTIRRVPAGGGAIEDVAALPAPGKGGRHRWLNILPGGRGALVGEDAGDDGQYKLHVVELKTGRIRHTLQGVLGYYIAEAQAIAYVVPDGTLLAVPFDLGKLTVRGRPVPLFGNLSVRGNDSDLSIAGGTLAYALPGTNSNETLVWVDRAGAMTPVDTAWHDPELEAYALSPDGARLAITISSSDAGTGRVDIWVKQMDAGPLSRLTFGGDGNEAPAWTADGRYVSYSSRRDGHWSLWRRRADGVGSEELVADPGRNVLDARWSADGAWLVAAVAGPLRRTSWSCGSAATRPSDRCWPRATANCKPSLSPDGRWLAYQSRETGDWEIFVRPFPNVDEGKWQISQGGGTDPLWSGDGRELFYRSDDGDAIRVADMAQRAGAGRAPRPPARAGRHSVRTELQ